MGGTQQGVQGGALPAQDGHRAVIQRRRAKLDQVIKGSLQHGGRGLHLSQTKGPRSPLDGMGGTAGPDQNFGAGGLRPVAFLKRVESTFHSCQELAALIEIALTKAQQGRHRAEFPRIAITPSCS